MLPFELSVRQSVLTQKSDYLLLGLASKNGKPIMTPAVKAIDRAVGGLISTVVKNGYFKAKTGDTLLLHGRGWPFSPFNVSRRGKRRTRMGSGLV